MNTLLVRISLFAFHLLLLSNSFSQVVSEMSPADTTKKTILDVKDIVVTGQYGSNSVQKSVYEVKVISSDVIKAKGANNLREALQNELSIDLGQDAIFGSSLGINGISGEGVKIMVDGVPVVGRLDGKLDLSQITINNIERIEVVEGPLSVMYGTDAMGGVINIITKTFQKEKVNLNLKGYYESVGQYNVEVNGGFAFKKSQVFLTAGRNFFNGYSSIDSIQRVKEWKPKEQYFADAKYMFTGSRFRVSLTGAFFRELLIDRSAPRRTLSYENNDTTWTYLGTDAHRITYRPRAALSFMYRFKESSQLDFLLGYSGFIRFSNLYSKDLVTLKEQKAPPEQNDTTTFHHIVFRPTYTLPAWKYRLNFQFGLDINQEFTTQTRVEGGSKKLGDYAAFGSIKINLLDGLDVQPAIRFSYNTLFQIPLIPSLNLRYNYRDKLVFRASYGRGFRAPSIKELYLTFFDSNHALKGNPDLKPEDGHNINSSLNYNRPVKNGHKVTFEISGFYNNIKNKIDWKVFVSPGPDLDTFEYFNLKKYITYGGDATLGYSWKRLQLRASAQLTRFELNTTASNTNVFKLLSPAFTGNASYTIPKAEIGINIFYKYTGLTPIFGTNSSYQTGTRNAYHSLDISLSRSFWKDRIQLIVGGKNLVGVTNVTANNVSGVGHNFNSNALNVGWGRTFFTSLVLHFSK
ncbi:MAG: TonB-dependent receptor [Bacteroidota bacterium]